LSCRKQSATSQTAAAADDVIWIAHIMMMMCR